VGARVRQGGGRRQGRGRGGTATGLEEEEEPCVEKKSSVG
jgi:hypothetical protein